MERPEFLSQKAKAKEFGGYWSNFGKKGFIFNSEEDAKKFAEAIISGKSNPITLDDLRGVSQEESVKEEAKTEEKPEQEQKKPSKTDKEEPKTTKQPESVPGEQQGAIGNSEEAAKEQQPKPVNSSGNKLVTDERYEELKRRMREKLKGQMNMGIDPEILAIGTEMALYHLEKGTRKFVEYAKAMIAGLGDVVRPYLKAFYNGARDLPEVAGTEIEKGMTSYEEVRSIDVANFDKQTVDAAATAETVAREQEVEEEAEQAKEKIRDGKEKTAKTQKKTEKSESFKERSLDGMTDEEIEEYGKTVTRSGVIDALNAKKEDDQKVEVLENESGSDGLYYYADVYLRGRYFYGSVDGYVYRFDLDGQVCDIHYIKNGKIDGTAAKFNKDGSLKKTLYYIDGALILPKQSEGAFGKVYDQFKGNAKRAAAFLMRKKGGEAVGALWHKDIGDISLVWGGEEYGLKKIAQKHPEVLGTLQETLDTMDIISSSDNRIVLESKTHKAVINKKLGNMPTSNWLLTAYEKKETASGGSSDIGPEPPKGKQNGTAPLQDGSLKSKDSASSGTDKEKRGNVFPADGKQ